MCLGSFPSVIQDQQMGLWEFGLVCKDTKFEGEMQEIDEKNHQIPVYRHISAHFGYPRFIRIVLEGLP